MRDGASRKNIPVGGVLNASTAPRPFHTSIAQGNAGMQLEENSPDTPMRNGKGCSENMKAFRKIQGAAWLLAIFLSSCGAGESAKPTSERERSASIMPDRLTRAFLMPTIESTNYTVFGVPNDAILVTAGPDPQNRRTLWILGTFGIGVGDRTIMMIRDETSIPQNTEILRHVGSWIEAGEVWHLYEIAP